MRVLILGGTAEARALAAQLVTDGHEVTSSLAGRVSRPRLPVGDVRIGGFGGAEGLARHLVEESVDRLVDATHPFATTMTAHAAEASERTGIPAVRLARPGWGEHEDATTWHWAANLAEAVEQAAALGRRPFVTTGRQTLHAYLEWDDRPVLVRVVEPIGADGVEGHRVPDSWTVLEDRGPHELAGELDLMRSHAVDVLLTKDSGGAYTAAKLTAARTLGVPVVVVARPRVPAALTEVSDVSGVLDWLG